MTQMPNETLQSAEAVADAVSAPKDLRAELETDLKSEFSAKLKAAGTLPDAVTESLVALLSASDPTSADVIVALALEDPTKTEAANE